MGFGIRKNVGVGKFEEKNLQNGQKVQKMFSITKKDFWGKNWFRTSLNKLWTKINNNNNRGIFWNLSKRNKSS